MDKLEKLINFNPLFDTIIGGTIVEYDIKSAGATAIREIKGDSVYNNLMTLEKTDRNVKIGLMMRDEKGLSDKVNELLLKWMNMFIEDNKIKNTNLIYTTRDSIYLYNKLPLKLKFGNVEFRNKDGIFSSMYKFNRLTIFFDSMRGHIICKGIKSHVVENSYFLQNFIKKYLYLFESCQKTSESGIYKNLAHMRKSYINNENIDIYKDIMNENKMGVVYNGQLTYIDGDYNEEAFNDMVISKEMNFLNVLLPLTQSILANG